MPLYLSPDVVLATAEQGAAMGCKEAPFILGGRPEDRWPPKNADAVDADHPAGSAGTPERPSQQLPRAVPSIYAAFHQEDDR